MEIGKFFDMTGYDTMALVQHVTDDCLRLVVLTNNSSHMLVAEVHAFSEPSDGMVDPGKLAASFPYAPFEHGWRVAYKLALADAVRRAHSGDPMCDGCGCLPGDGTTAGCTHPQGCGYFADCANDNAPAAPRTARERLSDIANHAEPRD